MSHYRRIYDQEFLELKLLEKKGLLQTRLHSLMLGEQNLDRILQLSPYTDIRVEAYSFLENKTESLSAFRYDFQRNLMEETLNDYLKALNNHGRNSDVYKEFYQHFTDANFRHSNGLDLP